jgi:hypothetical protein
VSSIQKGLIIDRRRRHLGDEARSGLSVVRSERRDTTFIQSV